MTTITSSSTNPLELGLIAVDQLLKPHRTNSLGSTSTASTSSLSDDIPEMIMSSSLTSFSTTDNDSLSSSIRSRTGSPRNDPRNAALGESPRSPRAIFQTYWTSPTHIKNNALVEGGTDEEDDLIARLSTLQIPFEAPSGDHDQQAAAAASHKIVHEASSSSSSLIEHKASFDDTSVDCGHALPSRSPTQTRRRQILPTPPPTTAISSSLMMPRRPHHPLALARSNSASAANSSAPSSRYYGRQRSNSTSVLLIKPSILRTSRYSCSAIVNNSAISELHHGLRNEGCHNLSLRRCASAAAAAPSPRTSGSRVPATTSSSSASNSRPSTSRKQEVDELKKSVSFYSQVSVFEFQVPPEQQKSQKGWSKYFV